MPSTSLVRAPLARRPRAWLARLLAIPILALLFGGVRAAAGTITMQEVLQQDGQTTKQAEKVRERVLERIGEGVASGVECVEPGLELPVKKEVLVGTGAVATGVIVFTTVFTSDPDPDPIDPLDPDPGGPAQTVPEPAAIVLLATGLGYTAFRLRKRSDASRGGAK
jgi:hypothetical protein